MNALTRTRAGLAACAALSTLALAAPAAQAQQYAVTDLGTLGGSTSHGSSGGLILSGATITGGDSVCTPSTTAC